MTFATSLATELFAVAKDSNTPDYFMSKTVKKVGILTAGGLAPCLSASIGYLIETYTRVAPKIEIICYVNGYMGLLAGKSLKVTPKVRKNWKALVEHGGSPIGNSRVKLTNVKDCVKRGLVKEGQDPQKVAADQLVKDGVDVLHLVVCAPRRFAVGDRRELGRERFHHRQPAERLVALDRQVNRMAAHREATQHRLEVAEVRVVPPQKQDLHVNRRSALRARRDGFFSTRP